MRLPSWISQHLAALRALLVLTVVLGIVYPLVITGVAQIPGLKHNADGSMVKAGDTTVGSSLIGQSFTDKDGNPLVQYFQSRPSAAGDGYDPTSTSASNLGPESVVDTLPDPANKDDTGTPSLLTQVCSRSLAVGQLEGVDGSRPFCTSDGVGAVLAVFYRDGSTGPVTRVVSLNQECPATPFISEYKGVKVECATFGDDYSKGVVTPIRGDAPDHPAVPSDAVTASGSGLDPQISVAYADLQASRVARERGTSVDNVKKIVSQYTTGRALGFMGEPAVNVLQVNLALDKQYPYHQN
ncbi:potassium-transporting ATPase subunit C [Rugosimonospora africana]|uniref:Potassium-transporting ATPase KdpC subunit n=1 Tax=Rugosimonospora africana TaxID=556532 RepID=A0A8J3R1I9_9ACTN|nr:potassium-transporting ATPase subunit C [Rugosimonospora africana]GIH20506.1 potassium-transporting ATPase KdpC subunit [Rugosimonospora africana]